MKKTNSRVLLKMQIIINIAFVIVFFIHSKNIFGFISSEKSVFQNILIIIFFILLFIGVGLNIYLDIRKLKNKKV